MMRETLPPLRFNDLFDSAARTALQVVKHATWRRRGIIDPGFQYNLDFAPVYDKGAV
jgi:hypothetical protein